jgi:hypothetical protein
MRSWSCIATLLVAANGGIFGPAQASIHLYRYDLPTPSCLADHFKGEIPSGNSLLGRSYRVETDNQGRLSRVEALRDGKVVSGYSLRYAGTAGGILGWDTFRRGVPSGAYICIRDPAGVLVSQQTLTASGILTEYDLFSLVYSPTLGREVWTVYTPQGKPTRYEAGYFSHDGVLIEIRSHAVAESVERDTQFDPNTGLVVSRKFLDATSHRLQRADRFAYDKNGDRIRADIIDAKGVAYGRMDYTTDLETRRTYKRANGAAEIYQYHYDESRQLTDASLSVNGKRICKFIYIRDHHGNISKTEARGPEGSLWATYPGRAVQEITPDGGDPSDSASIIYRHGTWW